MIYEPTMLDIGHSKQVFVDDLVIESVENVCRTWHQPIRVENPVIVRDRPWEQITYFTFNGSRVVRDLKDGIFKCVYQIWNRGKTPHDPPAFHLLYAESEDGLHWRKPELDVFQHDGRNTNIVIPNAYGMTYILDPHEEEAARRFKAIYLSYLPKKLFESSWKVMAATSEDLRHWNDLPERPQMGRSGPKWMIRTRSPTIPSAGSSSSTCATTTCTPSPGTWTIRSWKRGRSVRPTIPWIGAASTNGGSGRRRAPT